MNTTFTAVLAGAAVLVGTIGVATTASAQETSPLPPAACEKLEGVRARVTADADTVGSVLWLRARADHAESEGHEQVAAVLRHRADRREDRLVIIDRRLERCPSA